MIDYKQIIEELDVEKIKLLLEKLEIPFQETESYLVMPTVCHNEDIDSASWKLYYYKNNHIFYCYTECSCGMSIFKFLKKFYSIRNYDYDWYQDIYQVILNCSSYQPSFGDSVPKYQSIRDMYRAAELKKLPTYPKGILDCFTKFYPPEWLADGISKEAMDKYNILFSIPQNKIIIPHYNVDGELVGIRGRALNEWEIENVGKYMPVQIEEKWYSHPLSLNLYGLNLNKDNIRKEGVCFLFESEKACMQAESFKRPNCAAAVCGSQFNKHTLKILIKECHPQEIVVCFDKEELPREEKYFNKLYTMCKKYSTYADFSFIYDREKLLNLKDSPTDRGEEIFEKLLRKRVKVK